VAGACLDKLEEVIGEDGQQDAEENGQDEMDSESGRFPRIFPVLFHIYDI
jgi:hypothetical protein